MSKARDIADSAATINVLDGVTATATELNYVDGVTSAIQTQLDGKETADATIVKDADIGSTVQAYDSNLTSFVGTFTLPTTDGTADQVLKTNASGVLSFGDAGGGAWELLSTITVSSGASSISALNLSSGYAAYKIIGSARPQTANKIFIEVYDGNTNTNAVDYQIIRMATNTNSPTTLYSTSTTLINASGNYNMSIYYPFTFEIDMISPAQYGDWVSGVGINNRVGIGIRTQGYDSGGSIQVSNVGWGACRYSADIDGIRLIVGGGYNWSAGKVYVYGLKNS